MFISLVVAFTVTPWLAMHLLSQPQGSSAEGHEVDWLQRFFTRLLTPFLGAAKRRNRYFLGVFLIALIFAALALAGFRLVVLKMLPFDNKSEFQVVLDMPEGTALEQTNLVLNEMAGHLLTIPEVTDVQVYAGTASPIGFNGLVRQYYLRQDANLGDIQVNLLNKHDRERDSHSIARSVRPAMKEIADRYAGVAKVVEVPPGPPVMAPLVAEVYGPDYAGQMRVANDLRERFGATDGLVDIDDSIETNAPRLILGVDRSRAALLGVAQVDVVDAITTALAGSDVTYLRDGHAKNPVAVRLELNPADKADINRVLALQLRSSTGALVPMSEVVTVHDATWQHAVYHKDLLPVVYVTADMAGDLDSPLYGMFSVVGALGDSIAQFFIEPPLDALDYSLKWDGEWQITYETFRDMGAAYSVGLILIYLLVVGQFKSYVVPIVIMVPIPLTLIGILPGHAIMHAQFTATSMIGMIALAGIIVRNSILLVDFMNQRVNEGVGLEQAVVDAASVRARPIVLTALAAMMGGFFILDDPIFNGLAVSLIFGLLVSTVLTLVVIPLLYYSLLRRRAAQLPAAA
jgi:multidrug efflux pump subunit AcrB